MSNHVSRFYFAYGSNLDPAQMLFNARDAQPVGPAFLYDYRLEFRGGLATVDKIEGCVVEGAVWRISDADLCNLDRYEACNIYAPDAGMYRREMLDIVIVGDDGSTTEAIVYIMNGDTKRHPPYPARLRPIIDGYLHWKLNFDDINYALTRANDAAGFRF